MLASHLSYVLLKISPRSLFAFYKYIILSRQWGTRLSLSAFKVFVDTEVNYYPCARDNDVFTRYSCMQQLIFNLLKDLQKHQCESALHKVGAVFLACPTWENPAYRHNN